MKTFPAKISHLGDNVHCGRGAFFHGKGSCLPVKLVWHPEIPLVMTFRETVKSGTKGKRIWQTKRLMLAGSPARNR